MWNGKFPFDEEIEENGPCTLSTSLLSYVEQRSGPPLKGLRIGGVFCSRRSTKGLVFRAESPPQKVNWVKVEDDVPTHAVITGTDLFIENLNKSYNGTYRCVASNSVGESYDDYILYVYDALTTTPLPTTTTTPSTTTYLPEATEDAVPSSEPAAHDSRAGEGVPRTVDHAVIGGVVAVVVFAMLCLLIILGRYFARHKGTYFTHEAKGADDAADADTAIINAEGGHNNSDEKKEYYI
ncbi:cell adhesion molecule 1a [Osmerus eperlanus]|uniref:cell adhesion molecule 1a n=1 Tax=Osmerus eperlanus TaxID=29151 RepID=UPI002E148C32